MKPYPSANRVIPVVFWLLAIVSILIWASIPSYVVGWDLNVYKQAMLSLRVGHDPYADGMAVQRLFHSQLRLHPNVSPPYTYVYSPVTLPLLRRISRFSRVVSATVYWTVYFVSVIATVWIGFWTAEGSERRVFAFVAPAVVFFPGLLLNDVLFSGNVAIVLYAGVLLTAYLGWRRQNWVLFYVVALVASCFKAPLLVVLAIPVLSNRKQWLPAALAAVAGATLFAVQPLLWPVAFHNYLEAVELQFSFNRDFSSSPAGLLAGALFDVIPYRITSIGFYLPYATLLTGVLLFLAREYFTGFLRLKQWVPVMLVGVVLLNPRIMEYDVAPITLPMGLIAWRIFASHHTRERTIFWLALSLAVANLCAISRWKLTEGVLLVTVFAVGAWNLFLEAKEARGEKTSRTEHSL